MSQLPRPNMERWGTRIGVILAVTGSAVGLGNFLRFPGKAAQYEGGAFMVPYFIALFLLGLPIAWSEWAMGRYGGTRGYNSVPGIFRVVWRNKLSPYLGALGLLIPVGIYMYYVYIEAWCLGYAVSYLTGAMDLGDDKAAYSQFFTQFTGQHADGAAMDMSGGILKSALFYLVICFALNFFLIYRGLSKGIELFCKIAMPALVLCALIVLVRVLTLGTPDTSKPEQNLSNGLGYMWNPSVRADWVAASDGALASLVLSYDHGGSTPPTTVKDAQGKDVPPTPSIDGQTVGRGEWVVADKAAFEKAAATANWRLQDGVWRHAKSKLRLSLAPDGRVTVTRPTFVQSLKNGQMWLEAAGQIFFSLSVGFGIVMCYASYLRREDDIALGSLTACAGNEFCEVALGGMITIPAAFIFLGAAGAGAAAGSSFDLGFKTLPLVFHYMPLGQFVGFVFFSLLFLAAVTSSLSMLQPAIAMLEEGLGLNRRASVALLGFMTAAGAGFIVYFSKNLVALDTFDFWVGSLCLYVLATIQVILFGWVMGIDKGHDELSRGAEIRIPRLVMYVIKYVSPVYLLIIFAVWVYQSAGSYVTSIGQNVVVAMSVGLMLLILIMFLLLIGQAVRRWRLEDAAAGITENQT